MKINKESLSNQIKEEIKKAEKKDMDKNYHINCNNTSSEEWLEEDGGC